MVRMAKRYGHFRLEELRHSVETICRTGMAEDHAGRVHAGSHASESVKRRGKWSR